MAENRVTADAVEVGVNRNTVPGDARVTSDMVEVAMLKDVVPGGFARATAQMVEIGIMRPANQARKGDFFFAV